MAEPHVDAGHESVGIEDLVETLDFQPPCLSECAENACGKHMNVVGLMQRMHVPLGGAKIERLCIGRADTDDPARGGHGNDFIQQLRRLLYVFEYILQNDKVVGSTQHAPVSKCVAIRIEPLDVVVLQAA